MAKVRLILVSLLTLLFCSCERDGLDLTLNVGPFGEESRQVLLLYEAGFNSLSSYIHQNINVLRKGYLPGKGRAEDVVLVFSHLTLYDRQSYTTETAPAMVRLYSEYGEPRADTLKVWPAGTPVANKEVMTEVFNWVREQFPAAGYGAILSSHATGYLPEGYYDNPRKYEGTGRGGSISTSAPLHSFGQEYYSAGTQTQEMELKDLAAAIPYKLDYLVFDACLMGTVEVAWALRDVCSYLAFSPCEIPAVGFDFRQIAEHLLKPEVPGRPSPWWTAAGWTAWPRPAATFSTATVPASGTSAGRTCRCMTAGSAPRPTMPSSTSRTSSGRPAPRTRISPPSSPPWTRRSCTRPIRPVLSV